jgi:mono/diheme cytochrome c family protein
MRAKLLFAAGLTLFGVGVAGLVVLAVSGLGTNQRDGEFDQATVAEGARIFQTGRTREGRVVPFAGGMMMRLSCAQCHGWDGKGRRTPMFVSPNITYRNLTDPAGMVEPNGERGPTYTDTLIRRAVIDGIDAEGRPLAWPMPRWQLSDQEWAALLAYLKTLR